MEVYHHAYRVTVQLADHLTDAHFQTVLVGHGEDFRSFRMRSIQDFLRLMQGYGIQLPKLQEWMLDKSRNLVQLHALEMVMYAMLSSSQMMDHILSAVNLTGQVLCSVTAPDTEQITGYGVLQPIFRDLSIQMLNIQMTDSNGGWQLN